MSKQLPPQPHLDSLKKQARQLLKGYESAQPDAAERIQAALAELPPSAAESFTLRHAQQVVAREYGFSSWQKLADEVGQPAAEEQPQNPHVAHYERMARDLISTLDRAREVQSDGSAWQELRQRWPRFSEGSREEVLQNELSQEEAQEAVARENDFQSWTQLVEAMEVYSNPRMNLEQLRGLERLHAEFARLRDITKCSDSVLSKHLSALADAELIALRKAPVDGRQRTWARITAIGRQRFAEHVAALKQILAGAAV